MGTWSALWSFANKFFTCGVIGVYVSDRFVGVAPVHGSSMSPTLNPGTSSLMGLPIPLGLVQGRVTHIAWPPQRIGAVEKRTPQDTISSS
ncbi:hypothetical protein ACE6H2_020255 [Prunus campanulata]